jgi:hypothetical protein
VAKALAPLVLLLVVIGFFWKIVLTDQYSWLESPDLASQVVPWLNYQAQQFHMHRLPIWDPFVYGGQSLIGQAQPGLAYPLNWLLFYLPLDNGHISITMLNWYYTLIHYLAALFCYLLCRDLGRSILASMLAGVAFGLGGYIGTTDWPQMINGAIWGPLIFLFLLRAARGIRPVANAAFSGVFLGMSWLSGHHQIPIFLTLAAGGLWLYFLIEKGRINRSLVPPAAVFPAFFVFAGALQMWPAYAYGHTAVRWVGTDAPLSWDQPVPYFVHQRYSLSPIHLLGIVIPGYAGSSSPYAGVVALALAGLALVCWWRTKEVRIFFAVGLAGLFLALAKNDVFQGILYSIVPMFEKARSPAAAIYLFHFAIAVLLAFGLDALSLPEAKPLLRRLTFILIAFGTLTFLILFTVDVARALSWDSDDRVMMSAVAAFALAGLMYRLSRDERARSGLLVLIIGLYMVEIGNVSLFALPNKEQKDRNIYLSHYADTKAVAEFLRRQPAPLRVEVNDDDVPFNFGDWYGIDTQRGYVASLQTNVSVLEMHTPRAKALYGVGYEVSKKPTMDGQQEVFRDDNGLAVYKDPNALPRVWTVHDAVRVHDLKDARQHLQDAAFDLSKKTFAYAEPPAMERCEGDTVESYNRGISATTTVVDMKCRGMVIESENDAPGWVARIDGRRAPIYEAYTTLRGVVVGPGRHKIEMRYRPLSVMAGAVATLLAFLGALVLWLIPRGRRG